MQSGGGVRGGDGVGTSPGDEALRVPCSGAAEPVRASAAAFTPRRPPPPGTGNGEVPPCVPLVGNEESSCRALWPQMSERLSSREARESVRTGHRGLRGALPGRGVMHRPTRALSAPPGFPRERAGEGAFPTPTRQQAVGRPGFPREREGGGAFPGGGGLGRRASVPVSSRP